METIVNDARRVDATPAGDIHFHHAYEIIYVESGEASVKINNTEYIVKENSLVVISNLEEHSTKVLKEPYRRCFVILDAEKTDRALPSPELVGVFKNRPHNFRHAFDAGEQKSTIESVFNELLRSFDKDMSFKSEYQAALITQLLIAMYNLPNRPVFNLKKTRKEIFAVQKYIEQNFTKSLFVNEIAAHFYLDHSYLTHSFKQITGYSPKEYIILNRLSLAKKLLLQTDLSVLQISEKCGFSDVNNFIRYFKREFAITPKKYRSLN